MNRPWMPLYIADYLRDTSHLRAGESGAYLHLIMAYWISGRLPNDDRQLATIAKMTDREWKAAKPMLAAFFGPEWSSHKRIDAELLKTADVSAKRKLAAMQKWSKQDASAGAIADTLHTSHSTEELKGSFSAIGKVEAVKKKKAPPHGSVGNGRIWISVESKDWAIYAEDYRAAHGEYPPPDDRGGKWFKVAGEQARSA